MKHYFEVEVAAEVGINAAVVFENIAFWIMHNEKQGKNKRDGVHWMYATQKDIAAQFDYLTLKQVRTALERLQESGYLRTGVYNRHGYDKTLWYSLAEKGEAIKRKGLTLAPVEANGETEEAEGSDNKVVPIPDIEADDEKVILINRMRRVAEMCGAVCTV